MWSANAWVIPIHLGYHWTVLVSSIGIYTHIINQSYIEMKRYIHRVVKVMKDSKLIYNLSQITYKTAFHIGSTLLLKVIGSTELFALNIINHLSRTLIAGRRF